MSAELLHDLLTLAALVLAVVAAGTVLVVLLLSLLDVEPPPVPERPTPRRDRLPRPERTAVRPRAAHQRREHRRKVKP